MDNQVMELQASQLELVVSEKTIGSLTTNARQIHDLVEGALPKYDISNYSTDDIAKAKTDKALLNKAAKALNDKRIEFEREFMAPFAEFKEVVTDTVKLIKDAVGKIDTVIKEDEERTKAEKREQIEHLAEECGLEELGIHLNSIFNDKWLNKSTSLKAVEKEMREKIATITQDIETLKSFAEDFDVLVVRYKENLNLQETVRYANQLKEQREQAKAKEAQPEVKAPEPEKTPEAPAPSQSEEVSSHTEIDESDADAADAFAAAMGQGVAPAPSTPKTPEHTIKVKADDEKFGLLQKFLNQTGIEFTIID